MYKYPRIFFVSQNIHESCDRRVQYSACYWWRHSCFWDILIQICTLFCVAVFGAYTDFILLSLQQLQIKHNFLWFKGHWFMTSAKSWQGGHKVLGNFADCCECFMGRGHIFLILWKSLCIESKSLSHDMLIFKNSFYRETSVCSNFQVDKNRRFVINPLYPRGGTMVARYLVFRFLESLKNPLSTTFYPTKLSLESWMLHRLCQNFPECQPDITIGISKIVHLIQQLFSWFKSYKLYWFSCLILTLPLLLSKQ